MIERIKSLVLVLLVITSLLQSYLLAYSKPNLDPLNETEYIETEWLGEQKEVSEVLFPNQMILHFGDDTHTVLYPNHAFYNLIFYRLKEASFEGLKEINRVHQNNWNTLREKNQGIELHFKDGIPMSFLASLLRMESELTIHTDYIDIVWILIPENEEEVRAYFFSASGFNIYEATHVNLSKNDVEQFVGFGSYLPKYRFVDHKYYLPEQDLEVIRYQFSYDTFAPEQLQANLFVDPSISRKILDREGTEIITDGKRGLKIDREYHWMSYSDPVTTVEFGNDVRENLLSAVKFINRHGGWNGNYMLSLVPANRNQSFIFRQYVDSFPIISSDPPFGYMKIVLQKGIVSSYERSLINLQTTGVTKFTATLPGGETLEAMIEKYDNRIRINSIFPGYQPVFLDGTILLKPSWIVELANGTYDVLK